MILFFKLVMGETTWFGKSCISISLLQLPLDNNAIDALVRTTLSLVDSLYKGKYADVALVMPHIVASIFMKVDENQNNMVKKMIDLCISELHNPNSTIIEMVMKNRESHMHVYVGEANPYMLKWQAKESKMYPNLQVMLQ